MRKDLILIFLLGAFVVSCGNDEARKPVVRKTSSFMNESIERNKMLNEMENEALLKIIKADSLHQYMNSEQGFWYYFESRDPQTSEFPQTGDELFYRHEIRALNDSIIYDMQELGLQSYLVDKQELITGLQDGLKLMKEGDMAHFLFPAHKAYGYSGNERIAPNQPLIYNVELVKINKLNKNENN